VRDSELVVQNLCHRCETIRGATRVGNNLVLRRIKNVVVHTHTNRHVGIFRRRADQHSFGACLTQMQVGLVTAGEQPSRFEHDINVEFFPREVGRIALLQDFDFVTSHDDMLVVVTDFAVEFAVH
jgi:hypothetical protein